jgi:transcriptional regulator with XRE-family HTH domain
MCLRAPEPWHRLQAELDKRGWDVRQFARKIGFERREASVRRWLDGRARPRVNTIHRISQELDVPVEELARKQ